MVFCFVGFFCLGFWLLGVEIYFMVLFGSLVFNSSISPPNKTFLVFQYKIFW